MKPYAGYPGKLVVKPGSWDEPANRGRLLFVDAARGLAMLFVFLSHFAYVYFSSGHTRQILAAIGMVASPTFVLISGFMLGFLYRTRREEFGSVRTRMIDRGIFLITIGHALILLAHTMLQVSWRWEFITDALGLSMIGGALLIDYLGPRKRLALSVVLYIGAWLTVTYWHPVSDVELLLEDSLVGRSGGRGALLYSFPLLPWFSLYFAASVLGERVGHLYLTGQADRGRRVLAHVGVTGAACALLAASASVVLMVTRPDVTGVTMRHHATTAAEAVEMGYEIAEKLADPVAAPGLLVRLLSPFQKLPPAPVYLALYAGIGALLLYACFHWERRRRCSELLEGAAAIGRASLFVFVLQYFAYFIILKLIGPGPAILWPAYFASSASLLALAAQGWARIDGNRLITVGYPWFEESVRTWWRRRATLAGAQ